MASCSTDKKLLSHHFDRHQRNPFYDQLNHEKLPVINDDRMFSEESRANNLLTFIIREPAWGNIIFDETYVLTFLQTKRNLKNHAICKSMQTSLQDLIRLNFDYHEKGQIIKFWKNFRNTDINLAEQMMKNTAFNYKYNEAAVFPCYMGKVFSGDTSKAHVVLFVVYFKLRQIWLYDSLISQKDQCEISRFDYSGITTIQELDFKADESDYQISTQRNFHLLESFAHCLELTFIKLTLEMNNKKPKIDGYDNENQTFTPHLYKFFKTGFSEKIVQKHDNCSSFVSWGMYSLLKFWRNPRVPHRMNLSCYDEIMDRPIITTNQYISAAINIFLYRNIVSRKIHTNVTFSVVIVTNSIIAEDEILCKNIQENVIRMANLYLRKFIPENIFIKFVTLSTFDTTSRKDAVVLVFDRTFYDTEKIQALNTILKSIYLATANLIVVYPEQLMHFFRILDQGTQHFISTEFCQKLTYAMPSWSTELRRNRGSTTPILLSYPEKMRWKHDTHSFIVQLPPPGTKYLQKVIDGSFVPYEIRTLE